MFLQHWYSEEAASRRAGLMMDAIFGVYLLLLTIRVRDHDSLLGMVGSATLAYLLLVSPTYWSWYAITPIAFLALSPSFRSVWMVVALSFCARAVAPIDDIANNGFGSWNSEDLDLDAGRADPSIPGLDRTERMGMVAWDRTRGSCNRRRGIIEDGRNVVSNPGAPIQVRVGDDGPEHSLP